MNVSIVWTICAACLDEIIHDLPASGKSLYTIWGDRWYDFDLEDRLRLIDMIGLSLERGPCMEIGSVCLCQKHVRGLPSRFEWLMKNPPEYTTRGGGYSSDFHRTGTRFAEAFVLDMTLSIAYIKSLAETDGIDPGLLRWEFVFEPDSWFVVNARVPA